MSKIDPHNPMLSALESLQTELYASAAASPFEQIHVTTLELFSPAKMQELAQEVRESTAPERVMPVTNRPHLAEILRDVPEAAPGSSNGIPVLDLVGDVAVEREFLAGLARDGKLKKDPDNPGGLIVHGTAQELADRYKRAAEAVGLRENRPLVADVVGSSKPRDDWPGGLVLGAAATHRELQLATSRSMIDKYPPSYVGKAMDSLARNPSTLLKSDGQFNRDGLREALKYVGAQNAPGNRPGTLAELANLSVNVEFLAKKLDENDPMRAKSLKTIEDMDSILLRDVGERYAVMKEVAKADLVSSQSRDLHRAQREVRAELRQDRDSDQGVERQPAVAPGRGQQRDRVR